MLVFRCVSYCIVSTSMGLRLGMDLGSCLQQTKMCIGCFVLLRPGHFGLNGTDVHGCGKKHRSILKSLHSYLVKNIKRPRKRATPNSLHTWKASNNLNYFIHIHVGSHSCHCMMSQENFRTYHCHQVISQQSQGQRTSPPA